MKLNTLSFVDYQHINLFTTIGGALSIMEETNTDTLAVFDKTIFIGLIFEMDIIECSSYNLMISEAEHYIKREYLHLDSHIIEAINKITKYSLTAISLFSIENEYLGILTDKEIFRNYVSYINNYESKIVLEIKCNKKYLASKLFKIFEDNNSNINSFTESKDLSPEFVILQVFCISDNLQKLKDSLNANAFVINDEYVRRDDDKINPMKDNYDYLMKILDI